MGYVAMDRWNSALIGAALCALSLVACPRLALAQAGPGPIRPPAGAQGDSPTAARPAADDPKPPDRKDLWGTWKFDIAQSDDAMDRLKEAKSTGSVASPRGGSGGGTGGGNGTGTGIHIGGVGSPFPGGGGSSPRRGGGSDSSEGDFDHQQMQELTNPAETITLTPKAAKDAKDGQAAEAAEVDMADDRERRRVFYTDERKIAKSKDDKYQEYTAHWEDYRLVSTVEGTRDARATRSFEPAPGGQQLYENVRLERTKTHGVVEIRYVYDKVPPNAPLRSTSAPGLSSSENQ